MNDKLLAEGINLKKLIDKKQADLKTWRNAKKISSLQVLNTSNNYEYVLIDVVDFELIKTLAISKLEKELNNLIEDYENLN